MRLTTSSRSVSRFSRQCATSNVSQPDRPPRPVTEIALIFFILLRFYIRQAENILILICNAANGVRDGAI
jgi:hypothetical protein